MFSYFLAYIALIFLFLALPIQIIDKLKHDMLPSHLQIFTKDATPSNSASNMQQWHPQHALLDLNNIIASINVVVPGYDDKGNPIITNNITTRTSKEQKRKFIKTLSSESTTDISALSKRIIADCPIGNPDCPIGNPDCPIRNPDCPIRNPADAQLELFRQRSYFIKSRRLASSMKESFFNKLSDHAQNQIRKEYINLMLGSY